jgi:hypothetical protein
MNKMLDHIDLMMLIKTSIATVLIDISVWEQWNIGSLIGVAFVSFMMLFFNTLFSAFFLMPMVRMWDNLKKWMIDKKIIKSSWYYKNRK